MIRVFFFLLILVASILAGTALNRDPGYVLIEFNHYTLETTLCVGAILLVLIFVLLEVTLLLINALLKAPSTLNQARLHAKQLQAKRKTQKGLIEFSEGYWQDALKDLIAAIPNSDMPIFNYLTAARAAQELGNHAQRDDYLRKAQQLMPDAKIAVELTQAQLQLANCQYEQALATLRHLHDLAPRHPYVLKKLTHLYEQIGDWGALIELLPVIKKTAIFKQTALEKIERTAYINQIKTLQQQQQIEKIQQLYKKLPKSLKQDAGILESYCLAVMATAPQDAEKCLRKAISQNFHPTLVQLYSELPTDPKQLSFLESLQKEHGLDSTLHICLAKVYEDQQLWGKARQHLEQSITIAPSRQAYFQLGQLLDQHLDSPSAAKENYRKGLLLAL